MFISVVIPTYNRLPILQTCLRALEAQRLEAPVTGFEVVLVDDGSTDETVAWLTAQAAELPHVRLIQQSHGGPAQGRNRGVENARGEVIVFIDSDLVVTTTFLSCHGKALERHWQRAGHRRCFTYGAVINTANFSDPTSEPHKLRDLSWAYFATGNVAIDRALPLVGCRGRRAHAGQARRDAHGECGAQQGSQAPGCSRSHATAFRISRRVKAAMPHAPAVVRCTWSGPNHGRPRLARPQSAT